MKKTLALILAAIMVFSLAACGGQKAAADEAAAEAVVEAVAEEAYEEGAADAAEAVEEAADAKFIMGIDPEYPPFSYLGDDGDYTGFDVEVCKAACEKLGWEFEVFGVNWDEKLVQLDSNECDCVWSGMTLLDSMAEAGYVLSAPYYDNTQVVLVKKDSGITSSEDLAGMAVAVQLGTSGEALLNGDLADLTATFGDLVTCDSFLKCFTELDGNAVDAVFVDAPVAKAYVEGKEDQYVIIDEGLGAEQYGIAFRADDQELCDAIEGAVAELVADGTYAKIADKYPDIKNNLLFLQ
ncbi:MAG: transporter substrate-binding domain-containing protein [Lachnospiraceae bacterium]|nr:transporter substrate-binding domain-containing protein [Candidatus Darwinimomas equi]